MPNAIEVKKEDLAKIEKSLEIPKLSPMKKVYAGIGEIVTRLSSFVIKSADDYDKSMVVTKEAKKILKDLETAEDSIIKKPEGFVKSVKSLRKLIAAPVNLGLGDLNEKQTKFQNDQFAKRQKEADDLRLKAQIEADKIVAADSSKQAAKIEVKVAKIEEKVVAISSYKPKTADRERKFEVINPDEVERLYCSPDNAKIKSFIGTVDGPIPVIKGVKIWDTSKIVAR